MRVTHTWLDDTARIRVEGIRDTVTMYHCTDAHVAVPEEEKGPNPARVDRIVTMGHAREVIFRQTMERVAASDVDLIALTGDIINFPTRSSIDYVAEVLHGVEMPCLFTSGNHDWLLPGVEDEDGLLREAWWDRLEPLHKGSPSHCSREVGGIEFVCVDNSTFRVNEEQLAFVQACLGKQLPTVLLYHIPISLPTLRDDSIRSVGDNLMADPDWHPEVDWWDPQATEAFVETLARAENLVATFCGHIHIPHADSLSRTAVQYVGAPGYGGFGRMAEFRPW